MLLNFRHTTDSSTETEDGTMTLIDHLKELRVRLLFCIMYLTIGTFVLFYVSGYTFELLAVPYFSHFPKESLIGTGPAEAFLLKLKVAFFASILATSPLLFHQVWLFVKPGLYEHERKMVVPFISCTTLLFLFGAWLCYETILPLTYSFFYDQYQSIGVTPQIKISEHLSLTTRLMLGCGIAFETPVLTFFLARGGIVTALQLIGWGRYAVVGVFIISGVITPTGDILTQVLFAIPLMGLYVISILVALWVERTKQP
jgi:sec-independent protein translocase protein TatC